MEYPVIADLGEYEGYLPKQQFYNTKEVRSFYAERHKLSKQARDSKLAEMLQQPIMANTYRAAGVASNLVAEYIESVLKMPEEKKNGMITDLYTIYGMSGVNMANNQQISSQSEWRALDAALVKNLSVPMKKFVAEKTRERIGTPKKSEFALKVVHWFGKHSSGSKKIVTDCA
ncbi:MAG: hypothetical protein IKR92_04490 [Alphaproteobacteria bacterium]|nr:hypothetical protein [Alphaproteobacteria bacterium]